MNDSSTTLLPSHITTKRLTLRPYRFSDAPQMHAYLQEPDANQFLEGAETLLSEQQTEAIVARHILIDREQRCVWAIALDDRPIGAVSINFIKSTRVAEIGYHIKKPLWGQGYASEAVRAVVSTAFETYSELQRIQAGIHPQNKGSIEVAKKAGMTYEATLKAYAFINDEAEDEDIYAVLRTS